MQNYEEGQHGQLLTDLNEAEMHLVAGLSVDLQKMLQQESSISKL